MRPHLIRPPHPPLPSRPSPHSQGAAPLDEIFAELREGLLPLLEAVLAKKKAQPEIDAPHAALVGGPQWTPATQAALS